MPTRRNILVAGLAFAAVLTAPSAAGASSGPSTPAAVRRLRDSVPGIPGLPTGVPPAATAPIPTLPEPPAAVWPFPSDFSHTLGTGRLAGGASLWTSFLYDDHGPLGSPIGIYDAEEPSDFAPVHGGFIYPAGDAEQNGANIFTAAVGYTPRATYWRVDWNTLVSADIPIAEWTFTTPKSADTATSSWPANAGLVSSGIQYALVVSAKSARLIDAATDAPVPGAHLSTDVDMSSRSFVVRIPTSVLPVRGVWQVRLAAGLANAAGTAFATVPPADGGRPGGTNVYNVTFRTYKQEAELVCPTTPLADSAVAPLLEGQLGAGDSLVDHVPVAECGNFWMENDQANTLATGNVSKYALTVDWAQLADHLTTPEPQPTGYTNRWYVSPLNLGQGLVDPSASADFSGPSYLSRVQPYAVYVPTTYDPARPTPLTWILHSLGGNQNQYGAAAPTQLLEECQDRGSICATTEGFGDGQWYYAEAEVDFWDVWHNLAVSYNLDPDATVMSGYSMGGFASYKLTLEYPDLFAQSMPLEGPVICGLRVIGSVQGYAGGGQCTTDGDTTPLIVNAKWVPYVMTYGAIDEEVPFTGGVEQVEAFNALGYRYYAVLYPTEDHLVFALQNDFAPATSQLGHLDRIANPGSFTFTWYPDLDSSSLGIGPSGDYWLSGLRARNSAPGTLATVKASSAAIPDPAVTVTHHVGVAFGPTAAVTDSLTWTAGARPPPRQALSLTLDDVAAIAVDTVRAGLTCATVTTMSNGPVALTLLRLKRGSTVTRNGSTVATVPANGHVTVDQPTGTSSVQLCSTAPQPPRFSCALPSGRLSGQTLGPVTLGMTRARARSRFLRTSTRGRRYMDFFCPNHDGIRVGYPSPKLLRTLSRSARGRVQGRVVLALTANPHYALRGVRPGARLTAIARRVKIGKGFHVGLNWWYLWSNGSSRGVLKVRRGMIEEVGIADKQLTNSREAALRFLTSFG